MNKKNKNPEVRFKSFMEDWEVKSAENLCSISTGKSNTQDRVAEGKYPFYVRSLTIEKSERYLFDEEAVLTVGDGVGTGKVYHYVNGKYDLHQRVYRMYDFKGLSAKFFFYYFSNNFHKRVLAMTAKTSVDSVRLEMISKMDIIYPILANEQITISSFFQNLDNLITNHQKKYDKLIVLKKAMLVKMFPKDGAFVPEIRFKGFSEEWVKNRLGDIYNFQYGIFNTNPSNGGEFPVYGANGVIGGYTRYNAEDSIVIGHMGEYAGIVLWAEGKHFVTYNGIITKPKNEKILSIFGYFMLYKLNLRKICDGSGQPFLSYSTLNSVSNNYPKSKDEQEKIGQYFENLDNLISLQKTQLDKLKNIKKACFTKMFVSQD